MTEYQRSSGAIIYCIEKGQIKFLLLKYPTYWGFAKGLIEKDEGIEDAAKREVEEETGLKGFEIISGFRHTQKWFFKLEGKLIRKEATYLLIEVQERDKDKVKISHEHEDFAWLTLEEANKKMKIRQNKEMLKDALDFIINYKKQRRLPY